MSVKPKLDDKDFVAAYYKALKAGHGLYEFAVSIDSNPKTTWARVNYFRKKKNIPLPPLAKGKRGRAANKPSTLTPKVKRSYTKKPAIRPTIPAEDFIRFWQGAENIEQVQEKTGMPRDLARARANKLRKLGIPLKVIKLNNDRDKLNIPALIALAESLAPKPEVVL